MTALWVPQAPVVITPAKWLAAAFATAGRGVLTEDGKLGVKSGGKAAAFDGDGACGDCCSDCCGPLPNDDCCFSNGSTIDLSLTNVDTTQLPCLTGNTDVLLDDFTCDFNLPREISWAKLVGGVLFKLERTDAQRGWQLNIDGGGCSAGINFFDNPFAGDIATTDCCGTFGVVQRGLCDVEFDVLNNTCCKNSEGACVESADANCNGMCDEDEV